MYREERNMSNQSIHKTIPVFTKEQIEWLDKVFPENIDVKATEGELYINLGSRRVVKRIQSIYNDTKRNTLK